ncbi:hypothetical protein N9H93_06615 [Rhizobiaceae bacterium]|nr:hypothetical protein [Rhizobiaceae bacterium]
MQDFALTLSEMGEVVVIGGMVRDLFLSGNANFNSDVDFVINPASMHDFDRFVSERNAIPNRFGGYGLRLDRWRVDVWPLERTWAGLHADLQMNSMSDLLRSTFFNWDAALYDVVNHRVITGGDYYESVERRVLDVNLSVNPNPLGNAVRALKYGWIWDALLAPSLAEHVLRQMTDSEWGLKPSSSSGLVRRLLKTMGSTKVERTLLAIIETGRPGPLPRPSQLDLFLEGPKD